MGGGGGREGLGEGVLGGNCTAAAHHHFACCVQIALEIAWWRPAVVPMGRMPAALAALAAHFQVSTVQQMAATGLLCPLTILPPGSACAGPAGFDIQGRAGLLQQRFNTPPPAPHWPRSCPCSGML